MISVRRRAMDSQIRVTLNKSAREASMLSTGMFSESEGAGELE